MELKLREELSDDYKWDLTHIYKNLNDLEDDFKSIENDALSIKDKFSGADLSNHLIFKDCMISTLSMNQKMGNLSEYIFCLCDQDYNNEESDALANRLSDLFSMVRIETSFITDTIKNFDDETFNGLLLDEDLKEYHFSIKEFARNKQFILSKEQEDLLSRIMEVFSTSEEVYSTLTNVDLQYGKIKRANGEEVEINEPTYKELRRSNSREERKLAYDSFWTTYDSYKNTFSKLIHKSIKSLATVNQIRGYDSSLHASLNNDNIPIELYDKLIENVNLNLYRFNDYLSFRKKVLGYDKLYYYDLYNTLIENYEYKIPYEDAKSIVLNSSNILGKEYSDIVNEALNNKWIDVYPNKFKDGGAYMRSHSYDVHPYILMNYDDSYNSVSTLTHEIGHAVHSVLTNRNQPFLKSDYSTYIAEIASTTNEILLLDYLLKKNDDNKELKIYLIEQFIGNFTTTVYRQAMFAEFEKFMYEEVENFKVLTPTLLNNKYFELLKKYHGSDKGVTEIDELYSNEWSWISHFYYHFYVYQYATSYIASMIIASKIIDGDKEQLEKYLKLLKSGGSNYPIDLLKEAGVDLMNPESYEIAFNKFSEYLNSLKKLID